MPTVTHTIDEYSVQVYANDLRGNLTRWAAGVIYLFSSGNHVGSAYFARDRMRSIRVVSFTFMLKVSSMNVF